MNRGAGWATAAGMNVLALALVLSAAPAPSKSSPAATKAGVAVPTKAAGDSCTHAATEAAGDCHHESPAGGKEAGDCHHAPTAAAAPSKAEGGVLTRGEKLKGLAPVTLETLLANPGEYDGKSVAVVAKVRRACERKGCWMELAASESAPGVRVTFKDYGFFVPLDSAGSTAKVEGMVKVAELSLERAKHYESEGAKVPKDKDGKYREVQMIAEGLELRK